MVVFARIAILVLASAAAIDPGEAPCKPLDGACKSTGLSAEADPRARTPAHAPAEEKAAPDMFKRRGSAVGASATSLAQVLNAKTEDNSTVGQSEDIDFLDGLDFDDRVM
uniref:Uncharacterized protein n=1 Tax=Zooxanthella nutricula TaxID=1333877 RepID=A0A6V0JIF3_9DINO|mmetsp:Transcript_103417/g.316519  ORF Transcript_103417/g.316519 Transcript_103417/m.316519 type:complete len:110 (+) Transcript_103417:48-377(+)